jgi:hypothetical protein
MHDDHGEAMRAASALIHVDSNVANHPHTLIPDLLCHNLDWSPITAAASQSNISVILAGFVFAAMIVVLSVRAHSLQREAAQALKLLFTAFFGLLVNSYLLGDITGEQTCPRAETTEALTGGSLGTFAVITIVSLTWLVIAYQRHENDVLKILHGLVYVGSTFVVLLLTTSAITYLNVDLYGRSPIAVNILLYLTGGLAITIAAAWIWLRRRRMNSYIAKNNPNISITTNRAVNNCVWAALSYLAVSSVATGVEAALPPHMWDPPAPWAVYLATGGSLVLPLIVLGFALGALARTKPMTGPEKNNAYGRRQRQHT